MATPCFATGGAFVKKHCATVPAVTDPSPARAATDDERHLRDAIALARAARAAGNHPFGAVIAADGVALARAGNAVVTGRDATAHAELIALRAIAAVPAAQLARATLYASTEPCVMCSGAIYWAGVGRVVYGCPSEALGRLAGPSLLIPCRELLARGARRTAVIGPLLEAEALAVHDGCWG